MRMHSMPISRLPLRPLLLHRPREKLLLSCPLSLTRLLYPEASDMASLMAYPGLKRWWKEVVLVD